MTSGQKKFWGLFVAALVVVGIIGVLLNNRSNSASKAKRNVIQSVYPVTVTAAARMKLDENLNLVGSVFADKEVQVLSETQGRIEHLGIDVGSRVARGGVLLRVDDVLKKAAVMTAEANYDKAKKDLSRYEELYKSNSGTESQLDQARNTFRLAEAQLVTAKKQLQDATLRAPISGVVTQLNVETGSFLNVGTPIAYIVDVSKLIVKLNLPEKDAFMLHTGDPVRISTDVYPGQSFSGTVRTIVAKGDAAHTFPVEIALDNVGNKLRAGMFARVYFTTIRRDNAITIPREALVGSIRDPEVYVLRDGVAELRRISVGAESGKLIEALSGIEEGELVVIAGQMNLTDKARARAARTQPLSSFLNNQKAE
ncbi:MAG: efflux RND transporter periplasmic adaptor subunit [Chloroflexota bacterium]